MTKNIPDTIYNKWYQVFSFGREAVCLTVYVDVLLLINTLVNYFMLLGVKIITGAETKRYRLILGALTGGLSALSVFLNMGVIVTVLKFFTAALMVRISFPFISAKVYLKKCIWLFIISAVFSGVCLAVYLIFDTDLMIYSNGTVYFDIDITFLTVCTVISYAAITLILRFTDKKSPDKQYYPITLISGSEKVTLRGFLDTGNNLKEPFSFAPVIVTNEEIYKKLYSASKNKERIIPVSTVSGDGIMTAFKLDGAVFTEKEIHNIYLGCGQSIPQDCDVLLCPDLLGDHYEKIKKSV